MSWRLEKDCLTVLVTAVSGCTDCRRRQDHERRCRQFRSLGHARLSASLTSRGADSNARDSSVQEGSRACSSCSGSGTSVSERSHSMLAGLDERGRPVLPRPGPKPCITVPPPGHYAQDCRMQYCCSSTAGNRLRPVHKSRFMLSVR